ncbi:tetratricopeptide repeat protein [Thermodesulfobacteriota bacterium]
MKKIFALSLIYFFMTAAAARADEAMEYYNRALNSSLAYKKIEYYTKALQLNPDLTEAYEGRGIEHFFQRRFDKAIQDYNRVIASKPSDANAFLMRGAAYLKQEKGGGYRTEFKNLVSHYTKRRRFETNEMLDRGIDDLNNAIQLNPDLASAYSYRAEAYRLKGMLEAALHDAAMAIRLGGNSRSAARAYATRSKVYVKLGRNTLSEADYKRSIALSPYTPDFPPLNVPILFFDTYDTAHLKSAGWFGLLGIIVLTFVVVFKLTIPAPNKKD